jgi:hypothetical protein
MRVRFDLDPEATKALIESGLHELRPPNLQAEVLLRRALGLPLPFSPDPRLSKDADQSAAGEVVNAH